MNILVFTHDQALMASAEEALQDQGILLKGADDFQAAAVMLEEIFISLMVVDFTLPRVKTETLMAHVRGHYPDIPVVGLTPDTMGPMELTENRLAASLSLPLLPKAFKTAVLDQIQNLKQGGEVANVSPPLFAQLLEMEERSCILRVFEKNTERGGLLVFKSGRLVDARFKTLRAMEAACRILAWEAADVYIQNGDYPVRKRIEKDLQSIIMTSVHRKDEGNEQRSQAPPFPEKLKQYIDRKMGPRNPVDTIGPDGSLSPLIRDAQILGSLFSYGPLKMGFANANGQSMLFIPRSTPVKVGLKDQFPRDTITQLVSEVLD